MPMRGKSSTCRGGRFSSQRSLTALLAVLDRQVLRVMVRQVKDLPRIRMAEPFGTVRQNAGLCVAFISSRSAYYATAMKKTTAVFLKPGAQWDYSKGVREQAHWDEHARFIDDLFARGVILMVGPFTPE